MNQVSVSQTDVAAYLEAVAPGVDLKACLIDPEHNLVDDGVWLWDGTAGEHHPASEAGLALLQPDKEARDRWLGRMIRVVIDPEVVAEFVRDLNRPMELYKAA